MMTRVGMPPLLLLLLLHFSQAQTEMESQAAASMITMAQEMHALLDFKHSAADSTILASWNESDDAGACGGKWLGVECVKGHVFKLVLEDCHLVGGLESLLALKSLRVLSLKSNALNGSLPEDLSAWKYLKLVFLAGNRLTGTIPKSISLLTHLWRLDLSNNGFTGQIPSSISSLANLLTLRLEGNAFTDSLPPLDNLTKLSDFNVSNNRLRGIIPEPLSQRFNASTFLGNTDLCGFPLPTRCNQITPAPAPSAAPPVSIASSSSSSSSFSNSPPRKSSRLSTGAIIAIVVSDTIVLLVITFLFLVYYWNKHYARHSRDNATALDSSKKPYFNKNHEDHDLDSRTSAASSVAIVPASNSNKLVFFLDESSQRRSTKSFDLEDLLRASAEMLGKGSLGSAYKAVLEDGFVVAVKRLKDSTSCNRREFEQHMEMISSLRHPHLLQLRAYYYTKDEKLLVYDYMPNGSLHTLLHGNRGPGRVAVDWTTRMTIALGAARGLAYIHQDKIKIPHGNMKSSNILLDKNGRACVGDFGLALLMNSAACSRMVGYRAPEHNETRKISHKGDVYSFGVLLLEIITGKSPVDCGIDLPRYVQSVVREEWSAEVFDLELMRYRNIEQEMVALLHIAMACVAQSADARPKMSQVVKMIQEVQDAAGEESLDSQSNSSYLSEDATSH